MSAKPIAQQLVDDLSDVIDKYRDQGVTLAETIGGLEIVKLDLYSEINSDEVQQW